MLQPLRASPVYRRRNTIQMPTCSSPQGVLGFSGAKAKQILEPVPLDGRFITISLSQGILNSPRMLSITIGLSQWIPINGDNWFGHQ